MHFIFSSICIQLAAQMEAQSYKLWSSRVGLLCCSLSLSLSLFNASHNSPGTYRTLANLILLGVSDALHRTVARKSLKKNLHRTRALASHVILLL